MLCSIIWMLNLGQRIENPSTKKPLHASQGNEHNPRLLKKSYVSVVENLGREEPGIRVWDFLVVDWTNISSARNKFFPISYLRLVLSLLTNMADFGENCRISSVFRVLKQTERVFAVV